MLRDIKTKVDITDHQTSDQLRNQEVSQLEDHHALPFYRQRAMITFFVNFKFYKKILLFLATVGLSILIAGFTLLAGAVYDFYHYEVRQLVTNYNAYVSGINY